MSLCPPQIPQTLPKPLKETSTMRSRGLTTCATTRPKGYAFRGRKRAANGPVVHLTQTLHDSMWNSGGMISTEEIPITLRETCPSATSSTSSPTWTYLGSNQYHSGEKLASNRLSRGTTETKVYFILFLGTFNDEFLVE
jgi:hypothetical protein